jgi:uncharacterized membrane protein YbhN (UPF0104 family)
MKPPRITQRWLARGLRLTVTLILLSVLLARVDWQTMQVALRSLDIGLVGLAWCCFLGIAGLEVVRLRVVMAPASLPLRSLLRVHVAGAFFGNFLPGQVGADLYKALKLSAPSGSFASSASLILLLRVIGMVTLLLGAVAAAVPHWPMVVTWLEVAGPPAVSDAGFAWPVVAGAIVLGLAGIAVLVCFSRGPVQTVARGTIRKLGVESWRAVRAVRPGQIAILFLLSAIILVLRVYVLDFLVLATGVELRFSEGLLVVSLATLLTLLPISFAGLGVREGLVVFGLTQLAVGYEGALLVAVLGRVFILVISLAGGIWLLATEVQTRAPASADLP